MRPASRRQVHAGRVRSPETTKAPGAGFFAILCASSRLRGFSEIHVLVLRYLLPFAKPEKEWTS
jgi:hypothetical protein